MLSWCSTSQGFLWDPRTIEGKFTLASGVCSCFYTLKLNLLDSRTFTLWYSPFLVLFFGENIKVFFIFEIGNDDLCNLQLLIGWDTLRSYRRATCFVELEAPTYRATRVIVDISHTSTYYEHTILQHLYTSIFGILWLNKFRLCISKSS